MMIQEWKAKIKSYFQPKTLAERQKMMKYLVVFPAAILSGIVILWLLYSSLNKDDEKTGDAFNTEIPAGESEAIGTKVQEYEAADAAREKQRKQAVINTMDTIVNVTDSAAVAEPSAIEQSAEQYQQVQASLQDFYVPDYSSNSAEVAALQERIAELETQNTLAQQQAQPDELELMERSYQLAAKYMGTGNGVDYPPQSDTEDKGKRDVLPVAQVKRNVVSSLGASSGRAFTTSVGVKAITQKNTIAAVVAGDQSVISGQSVKLRLTEPMWVGNSLIPRNTVIVGQARLQGERLEVEISSIEANGSVYEVDLQVFDSDGQEGVNIPNSMESDAIHEIGANMGSTMGSSINLTTNTGAQIASDVGRGLINGVSQYLNKKLRTVKVHLKSGYKVMLYQPDDT